MWNCAAQFHHFTDGPRWLSSFQPQVFSHAWNASNGRRLLLLHVLAESLNVKIHLFKETFSDFLVWEGSLSFPYHVPNWFSSLHLPYESWHLCTSSFISCSTVKFRKTKLMRNQQSPSAQSLARGLVLCGHMIWELGPEFLSSLFSSLVTHTYTHTHPWYESATFLLTLLGHVTTIRFLQIVLHTQST